MIVSFAAYGNRLAAVFDSAEEFPLFRMEGKSCHPAGVLSLPETDTAQKISVLVARGVTHLVCGAMNNECRLRCIEEGLEVIPWICGPTPVVLDAFLHNRLDTLIMPGCCRRRRKGRECHENSHHHSGPHAQKRR